MDASIDAMAGMARGFFWDTSCAANCETAARQHMLKQESFTQEKRHKQSVGVWLSLQQS